ncbi:acetamidase [Grosmannia clavigera kw1407]|uniref:Acetamidase n=1 Tax=Grosmannia clavigera (strain kw1407 / UAMH 11150) TaxID=655863 RepID=F0XBG9_GROCL|nr:acetamidase [Grosmannia clavigera kw1407]EFX04898.1 acetamidase [Grosmannia clavigera kw1407]
MSEQQPWEEVVARKQKQRAEALTPFAAFPTCDAITDEDDVATLAASIVSGKLTSEAVTRAYIARAYAAHEKTNCLTEVFFADALKQAVELDRHLTAHGKPVGPLHGVPVTLKDQFDVQGYDSTIGYVGRAFAPAEADSVLVAILKSLGAVILAKTNLPQSIMPQWCETENAMFGLTVNPVDKTYTPGGSTGGESALLASHGSILGWGTDIGGSIRIPSHMLGLYGLKPSSARLPYRGVPVSTDGQEHVPSSVGPLARSLDSIRLAMEFVIGQRPWDKDARCAPLPWRTSMYDDVLNRPLVFGVLRYDGVVRPHPPIARVLDETVEKLRAAGHVIVEWDASLHAELIAVMDAFYSADGGEDVRRDVALGGEPFIPHVARLVDRGPAISVYAYWQLNRRKMALQQAYLDRWVATACDAVLMPPMPHTAVPHRSCGWVGYTKVWNVLDYPALVLPAGTAAPKDLDAPWDGDSRPLLSGHPMDAANRAIWAEHGARMAALRLPVDVQVVCRKLEEEKVLGIGRVVDEVLRRM